ncbi:MAG: hypothetical protein IK060_06120 [Methanomicrobium sp.]|nr:hypothetical protein [Methanomicrobium sp.]MBR6011895.1 hypothetical protein [Methanomicrobium sp.]MBR6448103.1 hypothetical protein [Methanomicrobium sp.]MBR6497152.1 hypothetical protein [Methanomicrobium sp.]
MNPVLLDCTTAVSSIIIFIIALIVLPALMPAAYATLASIILFIVLMSCGGYYISKETAKKQ